MQWQFTQSDEMLSMKTVLSSGMESVGHSNSRTNLLSRFSGMPEVILQLRIMVKIVTIVLTLKLYGCYNFRIAIILY